VLELHARNALAMGDGVAAKASLEKLPAGKRPADYVLLLGEAALLRGLPDEALAAVGQDPRAEAHRVRAVALLQQEDEAGAALAFAAGAGASGPKARLLADYARFKLHGGDTAGALALATQALKEDGGSLDALLIDAQLAVARGDLGGALTRFDKVLAAWPGNLAAVTGKAAVLGDLGRTKEMEAALKLAEGSADPSIAYLQARAAAARRDWKAARDILQANEERLAGRDEAVLLYGQVLAEMGQGEQARARLQPLLTRDPQNIQVRRALARAQLAAGDAKGAVETLRPLAGSPTSDAADLRLLADAAKKAGDPDAARLAERAKFPQPQALAKALADADTAIKAGNWGNAIALYERILAVTDGKNPLVLNNLAYAQGQVGNKSAALDYAQRALKADPANPSIMDTVAMLLIETGGDRGKALALLREAAAKAPGNATIKAHLAQAEKG
jgi:Flp pilus assembly protein TadD